ncbi:hypothetical protein, variant [Exophiala mesophila]|nr:hypothetical protein, variant [Exophiala mesophila]KIV88973.1 hypothetical protein, variant [Exophiala mesophila]
MATPDPEELERMQQLSDNYRPVLSGPKVGPKKPISELSSEYAQADQAFVIKTRALEQSHISYRTIQGDGQCGWRAVVFAYFEILLKSGDVGLINQEKVRLQSFEQTMRAVGIDYDIIVDMFDYTWEFFDEILKAIQQGQQDEAVLLQALNDENQSNSIIYHFKIMTSAFMQVQSERYENFLEMSVNQYCLTRIDPANQEIDHIGLQALTDAVISPAYIAVEVSYLDRSDGDQVTPHAFVPNASPSWPTIRLIYRPGHYDLIYKDDPVQVFLQTHVPQYVPSYSNDPFRGDMDSLNYSAFLFPGSNVISSHSEASTAYTAPASNFSDHYAVAPPISMPMAESAHSSYVSPVSFSDVDSQQPARNRTLTYRAYSDPVIQQPRNSHHFNSSPHSPQPSPTSDNHSGGPQATATGKEPLVRYNEYCYNYKLERHESIPLDPGTFGSSTQNLNHFTNSEFQPQIWNAKHEYNKID